ncbi:dihydrodipicolinate synthase family protein [Neorhizobium alkalisoli]|uniref:dihydrodipicolinate synthase family protein n=1 Tax=Neorhizobium alkalisoli TaxID=528178 RepID=UPI000CF86356|nr:dihydrodipicolinate synthase family protein [Neorhizobium alkalisoli]
MLNKQAVRGVFCAAATPLNGDGSPDLALFSSHCKQLLSEGCHGVALLGTTGEANSFSIAERRAILEAAIAAGIDPDTLMPGTGLVCLADTVELTRHALSCGVTKVVMLPPFYYKGVSDDGLFTAYGQIIEKIGDPRLRVILYNIPQISGVALSLALVKRLVDAFPQVVVGIKDSSGDLANMQATSVALPDFSVLAGADPLMLPLLQSGGAGCITATSNLVAGSLRVVYDQFANTDRAGEVEAAQSRINAYRSLSNSYVQIPTIKAMVGLKRSESDWRRTRPPLMPLTDAEFAELSSHYSRLP